MISFWPIPVMTWFSAALEMTQSFRAQGMMTLTAEMAVTFWRSRAETTQRSAAAAKILSPSKNNSGDDVVRDFQAGKDILDLSRARDIDDFSDLIANHVNDVRGDLIIAVSGSSDVTLEGVQIVDLNEGDFIF